MSMVSERLRPFGTTIFAEMTALSIKHGAVNLAQGFPDFDGPSFMKDSVVRAMHAGHNQYARTFGVPTLTAAIAEDFTRRAGVVADPDTWVTVTSGCTEAIPAAMLGLLNPGDEIILFEPFYDSYRACVALAGATPRFVALRPPPPGSQEDAPFTFEEADLRAAITPRTRIIVVNTPHNPTGKVFSREELSLIAELCVRHGLIAVTDEVYEHLVFDPVLPHLHLASFSGMSERTVTLSSLGKTFSYTGWKVGWAIAPPALTAGVRAAHQFLTFATCTPMQHAAADAIRDGAGAIRDLVAMLRSNRDALASTLRRFGLRVHMPAGTYFIMADHAALGRGDDRAFCRWLTEEVKVAAIPPSVFCASPDLCRSLARFAFVKKRETLEEAARRLDAARDRLRERQ